MYEHIFDAYQNTNRFGICLLEFNEKEIKRFKNNCIHCDGLSKVNNQVKYEKIIYGRNIRVRRKEGENRIMPKVMKKKYFLTTTNKEECLEISSNTKFVSNNDTCKSDKAIKKSGTVLLAFCHVNPQGQCGSKNWGYNDYSKLKSCKKNVISKHTNHFHSKGCYYSFGNKAMFQCKDNSSVSVYGNKKNKDEMANSFEMSCAHEIKEAVSSIMKFIPNIKFFVSPLLDSLAYYLRNNDQKKILTDVASKDYGCWQSTITVNAQTLQSHNEMDCTYTLISVPNQDKMNSEYDFFYILMTATI